MFGLMLTLMLLPGPVPAQDLLLSGPVAAQDFAAQDFAARNDQALSLIPFPWQQLHYNIVFLAPKHGVRAMIFPSDRRIEVYARPTDDSRLLAYDIAHELGHAIDITFNNAETRKKWMEARGIKPGTPWFGCNRCSDFKTPAGDFAETFAFLMLGPGNFSGKIASAPKIEQVPVLKAFFAARLEPSPINPSDGVQAQAGPDQVPVESPTLAKK